MNQPLFDYLFGASHCATCRYAGAQHAQIHLECRYAGRPDQLRAGRRDRRQGTDLTTEDTESTENEREKIVYRRFSRPSLCSLCPLWLIRTFSLLGGDPSLRKRV